MLSLIPDGKNAAGLGKASLLLHTTDPLLKDGGDLSRRGLRVGGIAADESVGDGRGGTLLLYRKKLTLARMSLNNLGARWHLQKARKELQSIIQVVGHDFSGRQ